MASSDRWEEWVLGAVIKHDGLFRKLAKHLKPEFFENDKCKLLWELCEQTLERGDRVGIFTVLLTACLDRANLYAIGGKDYLSRLVFSAPCSEEAEEYAQGIAQKARCRLLGGP